jgi:uncharacterized protein YjbI with pentapeptide repeats
MQDSLTSESEYVFVCDCDESMRSACYGEIFFKEHNGKRYCVLHYPDAKANFWDALYRKISCNDLNFRGVWFPGPWPSENVQFPNDADFNSAYFASEVDFSGASFCGNVDFSRATFMGGAYFSDVNFKSVSFYGARFREAGDFVRATFDTATFEYAQFNRSAIFIHATFREDATFHGATFSQEVPFVCADFRGATFCGRANFGLGKFTGAASFQEVTFKGLVDLSNVRFGEVADFAFATFNAVNFMHSAFNSEARFANCIFSELVSFFSCSFTREVNFNGAMFKSHASFRDATFRDYVKFTGVEGRPMFGSTSSLDLQFAKIEEPSHVLFHTSILRPHWFVNVNTRQFFFLEVSFRFKFADEIKFLHNGEIHSPYGPLSKTFRDLAINCEENHHYKAASMFRYWAMETERHKGWRRFFFWRLNWLYWLASGYGERAFQASIVLLSLLLLFAAIYSKVGFARWEPRVASESEVVGAKRDEVGAPLPFLRAVIYSGQVMTFQRPEPRPATPAAHAAVLFETVLGPLQVALLALAIRRKFMR